jgi:hypothetical protein
MEKSGQENQKISPVGAEKLLFYFPEMQQPEFPLQSIILCSALCGSLNMAELKTI